MRQKNKDLILLTAKRRDTIVKGAAMLQTILERKMARINTRKHANEVKFSMGKWFQYKAKVYGAV
jgi:hypothetical protein